MKAKGQTRKKKKAFSRVGVVKFQQYWTYKKSGKGGKVGQRKRCFANKALVVEACGVLSGNIKKPIATTP